jgi:hypothetical protein
VHGSQDTSASIATGYGLDGLGSIPGSASFFSCLERPDCFCGQSSMISNEYWGIYSGVFKRQGREADYSSLSITEVKKAGLYLHSPPHVFMT